MTAPDRGRQSVETPLRRGSRPHMHAKLAVPSSRQSRRLGRGAGPESGVPLLPEPQYRSL
jgi:hypothetical protein